MIRLVVKWLKVLLIGLLHLLGDQTIRQRFQGSNSEIKTGEEVLVILRKEKD